MLKELQKLLKSFMNASIFMDAIIEAQDEFRKDHILNKYNPEEDWREDMSWR